MQKKFIGLTLFLMTILCGILFAAQNQETKPLKENDFWLGIGAFEILDPFDINSNVDISRANAYLGKFKTSKKVVSLGGWTYYFFEKGTLKTRLMGKKWYIEEIISTDVMTSRLIRTGNTVSRLIGEYGPPRFKVKGDDNEYIANIEENPFKQGKTAYIYTAETLDFEKEYLSEELALIFYVDENTQKITAIGASQIRTEKSPRYLDEEEGQNDLQLGPFKIGDTFDNAAFEKAKRYFKKYVGEEDMDKNKYPNSKILLFTNDELSKKAEAKICIRDGKIKWIYTNYIGHTPRGLKVGDTLRTARKLYGFPYQAHKDESGIIYKFGQNDKGIYKCIEIVVTDGSTKKNEGIIQSIYVYN